MIAIQISNILLWFLMFGYFYTEKIKNQREINRRITKCYSELDYKLSDHKLATNMTLINIKKKIEQIEDYLFKKNSNNGQQSN